MICDGCDVEVASNMLINHLLRNTSTSRVFSVHSVTLLYLMSMTTLDVKQVGSEILTEASLHFFCQLTHDFHDRNRT